MPSQIMRSCIAESGIREILHNPRVPEIGQNQATCQGVLPSVAGNVVIMLRSLMRPVAVMSFVLLSYRSCAT
jgi:hypothetical protein